MSLAELTQVLGCYHTQTEKNYILKNEPAAKVVFEANTKKIKKLTSQIALSAKIGKGANDKLQAHKAYYEAFQQVMLYDGTSYRADPAVVAKRNAAAKAAMAKLVKVYGEEITERRYHARFPTPAPPAAPKAKKRRYILPDDSEGEDIGAQARAAAAKAAAHAASIEASLKRPRAMARTPKKGGGGRGLKPLPGNLQKRYEILLAVEAKHPKFKTMEIAKKYRAYCLNHIRKGTFSPSGADLRQRKRQTQFDEFFL